MHRQKKRDRRNIFTHDSCKSKNFKLKLANWELGTENKKYEKFKIWNSREFRFFLNVEIYHNVFNAKKVYYYFQKLSCLFFSYLTIKRDSMFCRCRVSRFYLLPQGSLSYQLKKYKTLQINPCVRIHLNTIFANPHET